ncbi:exosortase V [Sphingomonas sp. RB3P16]
MIPLAIGVAALVVPTMIGIAAVSWSTEQGAHGPIVLAIGVWLIARRWKAITAEAEPGNVWIGGPVLLAALVGYLAARVIGSIVIESAMMYLALVTALYLFVGFRSLRENWFPIAYLLFVLPPPGSWVAVTTQPLRLEISQRAVDVLAFLHYPVARSGLLIYVDQYILEVKAACGGLNSIISLTAIGLFYGYVLHNVNVRYTILLFFVTIAMAVAANFVRVLALVLITYYLGDRAAQGFLHEFAGLTMFAVAMGGVLLFDRVAGPIRRALSSEAAA